MQCRCNDSFCSVKRTVFRSGLVLKFVPVIVTVVPTLPPAGVNAEIVGGSAVWVITVNDADDVTVVAPTVTDMTPVLAPEGTVTVSWVDVAAVTTAVTPLNSTTLFAAVVLKFVPLTETVVPIDPLSG